MPAFAELVRVQYTATSHGRNKKAIRQLNQELHGTPQSMKVLTRRLMQHIGAH